MSRPTKTDSEKLSCVLSPIRCTAEEKSRIKTNADKVGLSLSEYVRQMALHGQINIKHNKVDFEAVQQLRKIGINLNQQTKQFNATGVMPPELRQLWQKLDATLDQMME